MRIHRLSISAFGPFAGTQEVDFDRLSAHGLFLLNGATGAGKTSVLDAICFALYGSVPGARQDGKRLRSDHADPAQEPAVRCEFSAQGRHFEVTRSPAWDKPSARGKNGFTTQQAKTLLRERVNGDWIEKSGRNDEAGAEITALLGMDREQFTRVVMLPQGDFAAFLRSKATDRLDLLQKLFGTQRFEAVEQELSFLAQAARNDVSRLNGQLELLAARAEAEVSAAGLDTSGAPPVEDTAARLPWLQSALARHAAGLAGAAQASQSLSSGHRQQLDTALARTERHRRLAAAMARKAAATEDAPGLEARAARLASHRQAEVLTGQLQAVDKATAQLRSAAAARESALTLLRLSADQDPELSHLDPEAPNTAAELNRLRSLLAVVEARLPDEERLQALSARQVTLTRKSSELQGSELELEARLKALQAEHADLAAKLGPVADVAAASVLRTKEAASADELLDVVRRHRSALAALEDTSGRYEACREDHLHKKQHWLDLREERLANAAAELASQLADAQPCPVCGSAEHPAPAKAAESALRLGQAEQEAREVFDAAEARLAGLGTEVAAARQLVAVLAGQGGDTPENEARQAAVEARQAAKESAEAADELATMRLRLNGIEARTAEAEVARAAAGAGLAEAQTTLAGVEEQIASLDEALDGLRSGHRSLAHRLRALQDAAGTLEKTVRAQTQLDQAEARAADARQQLDQALPEAGFGSAEEARAQLLGSTEAAALQAEVRAGHDEQAKVAELFASDDVILALAEQDSNLVPDEDQLGALRSVAASAEEDAREAALAAGMAQRCTESLDAIVAEFQDLSGSGSVPRERARMLTALADAAVGRGDNTYRMSLNSYVLAARLEQVALAASERLVAMSDGRYLLQHTDAKAARGAKSGLGLEVVDQWTGHRRDTSTLSGGESFMASLSLALGLADVVQHESGGIQIETLFVDEGFGSLDEQSLEQVMDALEGLRDGGRVVGLVSHVGEMKQRIGAQLQVVKGRNGSTLHISNAAPLPG
ncbi:MAG: chromosome segregation protein [Pseudarthrobacter sp.]|nr:chromosome segregation protein [Pseudarthrobacter sp.]